MTSCQAHISRDHHKLIKLLLKASGKDLGYQFPALATLIYVDWLPTGQWSAVSSTV